MCTLNKGPEDAFNESGLVSHGHTQSNLDEEVFLVYMNSSAVDVSKKVLVTLSNKTTFCLWDGETFICL